MGWWATTILGGDEAFDLLDDLATAVGLPDRGGWQVPTENSRRLVESFGVKRYVSFVSDVSPYNACVAAHVMGVLHLAQGVELPATLRDLVLQACVEPGNQWKDPLDRKRKLDEFARLVENYDPASPLQKEKLVELLGI